MLRGGRERERDAGPALGPGLGPDPAVAVLLQPRPDEIELSVEDTGHGLRVDLERRNAELAALVESCVRGLEAEAPLRDHEFDRGADGGICVRPSGDALVDTEKNGLRIRQSGRLTRPRRS